MLTADYTNILLDFALVTNIFTTDGNKVHFIDRLIIEEVVILSLKPGMIERAKKAMSVIRELIEDLACWQAY